jgi:hypothetical protein
VTPAFTNGAPINIGFSSLRFSVRLENCKILFLDWNLSFFTLRERDRERVEGRGASKSPPSWERGGFSVANT